MSDGERRGLRGQWTVAQQEVMEIIYADGATVPCGHPPPCSVTVDADGVAHCGDCGMRYTRGNLEAWAKTPEAERPMFLRLLQLGAKPWRGGCPACRFSLWFADSEREAHVLVAEHIADEHRLVPTVWKDH